MDRALGFKREGGTTHDPSRAIAGIDARHGGGEVGPALDGETVVAVDNMLVEVEPFIEHDGIVETWADLRAGLPTLGRIHALLADCPTPPDFDTAPASNAIAREFVWSATRTGLAHPRSLRLSDDEQHAADEIETLAAAVDEIGGGRARRTHDEPGAGSICSGHVQAISMIALPRDRDGPGSTWS